MLAVSYTHLPVLHGAPTAPALTQAQVDAQLTSEHKVGICGSRRGRAQIAYFM